MGKDLYHNQVKNALQKDGWQITHDPYELRVGGVEIYIDLAAEQVIAAQKGKVKIAVEIKSFISPSTISDFHFFIWLMDNSWTIDMLWKMKNQSESYI